MHIAAPARSTVAAQVLASVPDLDMLAHLPRFLERLLDCLRDPLGEVRVQAAKVLQARPLPHWLPWRVQGVHRGPAHGARPPAARHMAGQHLPGHSAFADCMPHRRLAANMC